MWRRAGELGLHAAYTYDHLSWQSFRDRPWYGAVPTLTAAALATDRLRIGTLVTSPNYRHPVPLAKEIMSLDDISNGRLTIGIGPGGTGFDATVLGQGPWSPGERTERFSEFMGLLDRLLRQPATTSEGVFYSAEGGTQNLHARLRTEAEGSAGGGGGRTQGHGAGGQSYGQGWVTYGHPVHAADVTVEHAPEAVRAQMDLLEAACAEQGVSYPDLDKVLLHGITSDAHSVPCTPLSTSPLATRPSAWPKSSSTGRCPTRSSLPTSKSSRRWPRRRRLSCDTGPTLPTAVVKHPEW